MTPPAVLSGSIAWPANWLIVSGSSSRELLFEGRERSEGGGDRGSQSTSRLTTGVWSQDSPEQRVVVVTTGVVADNGADVIRNRGEVRNQRFDGFGSQSRVRFQRFIRVVDICLMMLRMVNFHRLGINVRDQRIVGVGQGRQRKSHNCLSGLDRGNRDLATIEDSRIAARILARRTLGCKEGANSEGLDCRSARTRNWKSHPQMQQ